MHAKVNVFLIIYYRPTIPIYCSPASQSVSLIVINSAKTGEHLVIHFSQDRQMNYKTVNYILIANI